ncbi:MAG: hypothetical protein IPO15_21150 [Anaerolineae bacterium]|uniref:hypothetical protein n=1 Tax=Candidatus Amarolinea dominans TaxID=3140696 RepID=UPI00313588FB|nr:hypothetical protein [Anaerolineae bacterium]
MAHQTIETVIVGGGQAGLATSYWLCCWVSGTMRRSSPNTSPRAKTDRTHLLSRRRPQASAR